MDQPGKVAYPARGQLNKENNFPLSPYAPEDLVSRDGFSRPVRRQPAHVHTQAGSGGLFHEIPPDFCAASIYLFKPPYAIGPVPS